MKRRLFIILILLALGITYYIFRISENHQIYTNRVKLLIYSDEIYYNTDATINDIILYKDKPIDSFSVELMSKRDNDEEMLQSMMKNLDFSILEIEPYDGGERYMQIFENNGMILRMHRKYYGKHYTIYFMDSFDYMTIREWEELKKWDEVIQ